MSKEYIKDNGKVRKCSSNLSKMNVFEWIFYKFKDWNGLSDIKYYLARDIKYILASFIDLLSLLSIPISIFIVAVISIHKAKKECITYKKEQTDE